MAAERPARQSQYNRLEKSVEDGLVAGAKTAGMTLWYWISSNTRGYYHLRASYRQ